MPSNLFSTQDQTGGPPSGSAGGDITGTYPNPTVSDAAYPHRYTIAQRYALTPTDGTLVYDTTCRCLFVYNVDRWYPAQPIDPRSGFMIEEDWVTGDFAGTTGWKVTGTGGSSNGQSAIISTNAAGQFYVSQTDAGAYSAAFYNNLYSTGAMLLFFDARTALDALSTASQEYVAVVGFTDVAAAVGISLGIYFSYDRATDGDFWVCKTTNGGGTTKTVTAVVPAARVYNTLSVAYFSGSVKFYIDGTLVATHTTRLPGDSEYIGPRLSISKTVGASTLMAIINDYFCTYTFFNTRR